MNEDKQKMDKWWNTLQDQVTGLEEELKSEEKADKLYKLLLDSCATYYRITI